MEKSLRELSVGDLVYVVGLGFNYGQDSIEPIEEITSSGLIKVKGVWYDAYEDSIFAFATSKFAQSKIMSITDEEMQDIKESKFKKAVVSKMKNLSEFSITYDQAVKIQEILGFEIE